VAAPTEPSKPVWLLDVDGVVNALSRTPVPGSWPAAAWVQHAVAAEVPGTGRMVFPILAAQPVLDFVAGVVRSGAADVIWHSTWRESAVTDLGPALGLPELAISFAPEWTDRSERVWWKLPAAERVVASGRRLVWTDDDIAVLPDQVAELAAREDTLLIAPDPVSGLTGPQLDAIARFVGLDEPATPADRPSGTSSGRHGLH
jgi:hypothetical protein